ncbi:MAG: DUF3048 domain-containing protein [bacterium]|nr:DUF3048 domain-containing protein [bacterium]
MQILRRFLLGIIFLLTLVCTGMLIVQVFGLPIPHIRFALPAEPRENVFVAPLDSSSEKSIISYLSLSPFQQKHKSYIGIVVENHEDARPHHRGLDKADIIQEYFAEGFITRFFVLFDRKDLPKVVGPVRSLRPYVLDGSLPWRPVIFHAGGSPEALERVENSDTGLVAFNGLWLESHFLRADDAPAPHDLFLQRDRIQDLLSETPAIHIPVPLYATGPVGSSGSGATAIRVNYFSSLHNVQYSYDQWLGRYTRINGGIESPAHPRNIVFLATSTNEIGPYGRLSIKTTGQGKVLLFRSGKVMHGTWSRDRIEDPFAFQDASGKMLTFANGQTWMTFIDDFVRVKWE